MKHWILCSSFIVKEDWSFHPFIVNSFRRSFRDFETKDNPFSWNLPSNVFSIVSFPTSLIYTLFFPFGSQSIKIVNVSEVLLWAQTFKEVARIIKSNEIEINCFIYLNVNVCQLPEKQLYLVLGWLKTLWFWREKVVEFSNKIIIVVRNLILFPFWPSLG